jgi:hypothetical protein
MSITEETGNLGAQAAPPPRPRAGKRDLVGYASATAILGLFIWWVYVMFAIGSIADCWTGGGQASGGSVAAAAALAGCLWLAVNCSAWRLKRRLARLFAGFVGLYVVALVTLWEISPSLWGQRHC